MRSYSVGVKILNVHCKMDVHYTSKTVAQLETYWFFFFSSCSSPMQLSVLDLSNYVQNVMIIVC